MEEVNSPAQGESFAVFRAVPRVAVLLRYHAPATTQQPVKNNINKLTQ